MRVHEGYAGAQRASDHADRIHQEPLWSKLAWVRLLEYFVALRKGLPCSESIATFTTERFRAWCATHSLPNPPDDRAFGNVVRRAAREGLIFDTEKRVKEGSHGREVVLWGVV